MATRSRIAILNTDGSVNSIYCHYDGYPSNNGAILVKHYNNEEIIRKLISLGSLSSLGEKIEPSKGSNHSFRNPEDGVTVAHHRDMGEPISIDTHICLDDWMLKSFREEWNYIWKDGKWFVVGEKRNILTELASLNL